MKDDIEKYYDKLRVVNEPLNESEKQQINSNTHWIPLEEIVKEEGEHHDEQ